MSFESKLRRKVKRELKAEEKKARLEADAMAAKQRTQENIARLEEFNASLEDNIRKYRQKARQAQKNNNMPAFNSYVAQIMSAQRLLDSNSLMLVDAIRHADNQQINRDMMMAQSTIGELVNPKLNLRPKDIVAARQKFTENALNLNQALEIDEQFSSMFEGIYEGAGAEMNRSEFDKIAAGIINEVALEEALEEESTMSNLYERGDLADLKEQMRKEREQLAELRRKK